MSPRKKQGDVPSFLDETVPPCEHCEKYFFYQNSTFNLFDATFLGISVATYLMDIVTDMIVCVQYFSAPEYFWGFLTLFFTLVPSVIVHVFSARWYLLDDDDMTTSDWLLHIFQLGTLKRYVCVFQTGMDARHSHDSSDFELLYHQQSDVSMLRLFESFMESAPQLVLQLYIMVATNDENYFTGVSAAVSLISLCWAIAAYSKAQRKMRIDKAHISWPGLVFQTIWRIGMVSSRVMSLVLFASIFKAYIFPVVAAHWLVMFLWVYQQDTDFCATWPEERLFNITISIIYIFCFFNLKEGSSRFRIVAFYSIIFIEDMILVILWSLYSEPNNQYNVAGYSIVFGGFFVGILSMVLYYRCFHPSGQISLSTTILKDIEKHCPHDHVYSESTPGSCGLDAEISFRSRSVSPHKSPRDFSFNSGSIYQLNYSVTSEKSTHMQHSYDSCKPAIQRSVSDSCLLDLTTRMETQNELEMSHVNCLVQEEITYELGLTFTDYRLNCTGFASILAEHYDAAKENVLMDSSLQEGSLENHQECIHARSNQDLEDSIDMTQGSSLKDMPNMSLQSPGLMTRYEAEKIYLDILEQGRPPVPSQRKLVFKSGEDMSRKIEDSKKMRKKHVVEPTTERIKKKQKPYILWKLDKQRKGVAAEKEMKVTEGQHENIPNTKKNSSTELNKEENMVNHNGECKNECFPSKSERNSVNVDFPTSILKEVNPPNYQSEQVEPILAPNEDYHKTFQTKEKTAIMLSLGHGRPQEFETIPGLKNRPMRKHSFKSSVLNEATPSRKHSFKSSVTSENIPSRKQSFKSSVLSEATPSRKHSFKSSVISARRTNSFKSSSMKPSIDNKENSPCKSNSKKDPKTFHTVLREVTPVNAHASKPTNVTSTFDSKQAYSSPSVRSLQLSLFSPPDNTKSPGTAEKKGRRSLGKIPLNTVAHKISMFTN